MWWYAIPVLAAGGKIVYDALNPSDGRPKSALELNLERLNHELDNVEQKKIAILGQPGAGKSSILRNITKNEVKPLPLIGSQTDATDWSNDANTQLLSYYREGIFVDIPGYDTCNHPISVFQSKFPFWQFDSFVFVINGKAHDADEQIYERLKDTGKPICFIRSFIDATEDKYLSLIKSDIKSRFNVQDSAPIVFLSNKSKEGINEVISFLDI